MLSRLAQQSKLNINGCLEWQGLTIPSGYGYIWVVEQKKTYVVHRLSYELTFGSIPTGILVLHRCDNRVCINPMHLFLGTDADNAKDKYQKKRQLQNGENNGNAILTLEKARQIRTELNKGWSMNSIAKQFNVSRSCIEHIRYNRTWKDTGS